MVEANTLLQRVENALDSIRPYLQADGGDVEVIDISSEGHLTLRLLGSCQSCSMSHMTMRAGIERAVMKSVPEVISVEALKEDLHNNI